MKEPGPDTYEDALFRLQLWINYRKVREQDFAKYAADKFIKKLTGYIELKWPGKLAGEQLEMDLQ